MKKLGGIIMKLGRGILSLSLVSLIALAGCGSGDDKQTSDNSNDAEAKGNFKEVETFDIEGQINQLELSLDEKGEVFLWSEQEKKLSDEKRKNVRLLEEETITLDEDIFSQGASLMPSGKVYTDHSDFNADTYNMYIYDPQTGEEVEKEVPEEAGEHIFPILHPSTQTINEDHDLYLHSITDTKNDVESFIWNYETNEVQELKIVEELRNANDGEEIYYPRFQLSSDGKQVYVLVDDNGFYVYDMEDESLEKIFEQESVVFPKTYTNMITSDDAYIPYVDEIVEGEDGLELMTKLYDIESEESIDLGDVKRVFTQTDGNLVLYKEDTLYNFDVEKEEEIEIHTFDLAENEEVVNLAVSEDGSTIVYVLETEITNDGEVEISQTAHVLKNNI